MRIGIAASQDYPAHGTGDASVIAALETRGHAATSIHWGGDVSEYDAVVLGATWDYTHRYAEFVEWLTRADRQTVLVNDMQAVLWSSTKSYMLDLQDARVPTIPTQLVHLVGDGPTDAVTVAAVCAEHGWAEVVVKACVSASAIQLFRGQMVDLMARSEELTARLGAGEAIVQPYLQAVASAGEYSLMYFGGQFHHAVLKRPADGDFRVQSEYGGQASAATPPAAVRAVADAALTACPHEPTYARVDVVAADPGGAHGPCLIEVELVEPHLFHSAHDDSAATLARAIETAVTRQLAPVRAR